MKVRHPLTKIRDAARPRLRKLASEFKGESNDDESYSEVFKAVLGRVYSSSNACVKYYFLNSTATASPAKCGLPEVVGL
jgi:hypothetical protein